MPILNARREMFAQALADGKTQLDAYVLAGFRPAGSNACLLAKNPQIIARVNEILTERSEMKRRATEMAVHAAAITELWIIQHLVENATKSAAAGDYSPSNKALELLGKQLGMFIDRSETKSDTTLTVKDEPAAIREEIAADLAPPVDRGVEDVVSDEAGTRH